MFTVRCSKLFTWSEFMLRKFTKIFEKTKLSEALNEMLTMHKGVFEFFLLQGKLHLTVIPKVIFIAYPLYHFLNNITSLQKQYFIWESLMLTLLLQQAVNLFLIKSSFLLLGASVILLFPCVHTHVQHPFILVERYCGIFQQSLSWVLERQDLSMYPEFWGCLLSSGGRSGRKDVATEQY